MIPYAEHMDGCTTVAKWASRAGVDRSTLKRTVRRETGHSPSEVLNLTRVHRALALYRGPMTLQEAAIATGYSDQFTLSDACVSWLGVRPTAIATKKKPRFMGRVT